MKWKNRYWEKFEWHKWFAWHPINVYDESVNYWYWLIFVEKRVDEYLDAEYRLIK